MRSFFYKGRFIFFPLAFCCFLAIASYVVMQLWNNILPEVIHVESVSFWQAMGILILCKILFGFGKGGGPDRFKQKMWERRMGRVSPDDKKFDWANCLTDEQREKLRRKMEERGRCNWGPFADRNSDKSANNDPSN